MDVLKRANAALDSKVIKIYDGLNWIKFTKQNYQKEVFVIKVLTLAASNFFFFLRLKKRYLVS